jgi:CheY-like chemotaxis protein
MNLSPEILLVEDNAFDAELAIRALKSRNLANKLIHVTDGQAALDYLFGAHPEKDGTVSCPETLKVVLLDLKLPKIDGLDVLRAIRSNPRTKMLPVVILTSSREESDVIETYHLGANSYIVKPVDFDKFSEAVSNLGLYWCVLNVPAPAKDLVDPPPTRPHPNGAPHGRRTDPCERTQVSPG